MSGLDDLDLDADGFLDMAQFGAEELSEAELADLRTELLDDPVDEPTDDRWSELLDHAFETDAELDTAPVDDLGFDPVTEPGLFDTGDDAPFGDAADLVADRAADDTDDALDLDAAELDDDSDLFGDPDADLLDADLGLDDGSGDVGGNDPFDGYDLDLTTDVADEPLPVDADEPTFTTDDFEDQL